MVIKDPWIAGRWTICVNTKDQIASLVLNLIHQIQTQSGRKVKRIYCDGGSEFINETLKSGLIKDGIEWHDSPPYTPELNPVSENAVRTDKDGWRTLLAGCNLPERFWRYGAEHSTYVRNVLTLVKILA